MTARVASGIGIGLLLALLAGGCGGRPVARDGAAVVHPSWSGCSTETVPDKAEISKAGEALGLPPLGADFTPVAAVLCGTETQKRPGGRADVVRTERRAYDVSALVTALRLPDEPRGGVCTAEIPFVPWVVLLDATARWVRPGIPASACGKPRREVLDAYQNLRTELVATRVVRPAEPDAAARSGCDPSAADMAWVHSRIGPSPATGADTALPPKAEVRSCVFGVPPQERGAGKPSGFFERGGVLPPATWTKVRHELAAATPPRACTTPATRFAVLDLPTVQIYAQADGCHLVLFAPKTGAPTLRQAPPTLAPLLFSIP